jgi:regulator of PEP synthase PpsR (kinase-PPPase family)
LYFVFCILLYAYLPTYRIDYGTDDRRLSEIRNERRPGSNYAKLENCRYEINEATSMMKKESIPWVATTSKSIEEIATTVLQSIKSDKTILG